MIKNQVIEILSVIRQDKISCCFDSQYDLGSKDMKREANSGTLITRTFNKSS